MSRYSLFALPLAAVLGVVFSLAFAGSSPSVALAKSACGCVDCKCPDCNGEFCTCDVCACGSCACLK